MNAPPVQCSSCGVAVRVADLNRPDLSACPGCGALIRAEVFPAFFRPIKPGRAGEAVQMAEEASCFYHPEIRAAIPCEACGRFVCTLCDCEVNGQHLCPTCLDVSRKKGKIRNLENQRTLYDTIALSLAIYPLLIFYFTLITAPMALFIAIRFWNTPTSILRRTKTRFVAAIILASIQLAAWAVGLYFVFAQLGPAMASSGKAGMAHTVAPIPGRSTPETEPPH